MPDKYGVKTGEIKVAETPDKLTALGLGSCVATTLYDSEKQIGALAHVMLPESRSSDTKKPGKYADTAVKELIKKMKENECKKKASKQKLLVEQACSHTPKIPQLVLEKEMFKLLRKN